MSAWVRTETVAVSQNGGQAGACLTIYDLTRGDRSKSIFGTTDWQKIIWEFQTEDESTLRIGCRLGHFGSTCTGTAWFDDVTLEYLGPGIEPQSERAAEASSPAAVPSSSNSTTHPDE